VRRTWLRIGSVAAFLGALGAVVSAVAGGINEPTGIAILAAVVATMIAYGFVPLWLTIAMRRSALSTWWAVATSLLPAIAWGVAGLALAMPAFLAIAPTIIEAVVSIAPSASALWILIASIEAVRSGMRRWSLVFIGAFVAVLIIGSVLIELSGFDIRKVLVPLGWTVWMIDVGRALRREMSPVTAAAPAIVVESSCANCGAPRRKDGLAFCSSCGLPYGVSKTGN
jgi:hypothetical protein